MASAQVATAPNSLPTRIIIEPLNGEGNVMERGKTAAKNMDDFLSKMDYAATRCPKFVAIKTTLIQGAEVTYSFYTREKGKTEWVYAEQFPGTPALPTTPKQPAKPKARATKGVSGTTHAKGKPGVIAAIIELLKGSVDEGGLTVKEIVGALVKKFPSRDAESMEITVRCQLGRIPKQRHLKIGKQKIENSKEIKYYIS